MLQGGEKKKNLRVSYHQDMQFSIWAKFKAVMNNSISFGGAEVLGGINNGQAFFSPHCTLPTSHHRVITPLAKEHTVGGRDKEGQGKGSRIGQVCLSCFSEQVVDVASAAQGCAYLVELQASKWLLLPCSVDPGR